MELQSLSAVLLIGSFAFLAFHTVMNAPGLYSTQEINERLEIINAYRTRWLISQAAAFIYIALLIAGFALLAYVLREVWNGWLPLFAALFTIGANISGAYFVYLQVVDSRGGYSGAYPTPEKLAYWFMLAGALLFGITFLQTNLPPWLGYLTAGTAIVYGLIYFVTGAGFMAPFLLGIVDLVIGIVLLVN